MKFKSSPESGLCTAQHPHAPLGRKGLCLTYEVTDIPAGVDAAEVARLLNGTTTFLAERTGRFSYSFAELGVGKILPAVEKADGAQYSEYVVTLQPANYGEGYSEAELKTITAKVEAALTQEYPGIRVSISNMGGSTTPTRGPDEKRIEAIDASCREAFEAAVVSLPPPDQAAGRKL